MNRIRPWLGAFNKIFLAGRKAVMSPVARDYIHRRTDNPGGNIKTNIGFTSQSSEYDPTPNRGGARDAGGNIKHR